MKNRAFIVSMLAALLFLAACGNTFQGIGRDIENMGENIQEGF